MLYDRLSSLTSLVQHLSPSYAFSSSAFSQRCKNGILRKTWSTSLPNLSTITLAHRLVANVTTKGPRMASDEARGGSRKMPESSRSGQAYQGQSFYTREDFYRTPVAGIQYTNHQNNANFNHNQPGHAFLNNSTTATSTPGGFSFFRRPGFHQQQYQASQYQQQRNYRHDSPVVTRMQELEPGQEEEAPQRTPMGHPSDWPPQSEQHRQTFRALRGKG